MDEIVMVRNKQRKEIAKAIREDRDGE